MGVGIRQTWIPITSVMTFIIYGTVSELLNFPEFYCCFFISENNITHLHHLLSAI